MSLLLETIRVAERTFQHLPYHQQRLEKAMRQYFPQEKLISLTEKLNIPDYLDNKVYKCRVIYDKKIRRIEFHPYSIQPVRSLALANIPPAANYACKWENRMWINQLKSQYAADDILMVRNGLLTDTSYANIALWDGYRWFTPRVPLLEGTKRARLLDENLLVQVDIRIKDLPDFQYLKLLNAMMEFDEAPTIPIQNIKF